MWGSDLQLLHEWMDSDAGAPHTCTKRHLLIAAVRLPDDHRASPHSLDLAVHHGLNASPAKSVNKLTKLH